MFCFHILVPLFLALQYLLMQPFMYLDFSAYEPPAGDFFNILLLKFGLFISFNTLKVIHTLTKYFFHLQMAPVFLNNLAPCLYFTIWISCRCLSSSWISSFPDMDLLPHWNYSKIVGLLTHTHNRTHTHNHNNNHTHCSYSYYVCITWKKYKRSIKVFDCLL